MNTVHDPPDVAFGSSVARPQASGVEHAATDEAIHMPSSGTADREHPIVEARTDRQPLELLQPVRDFAPLDLPPGLLFPTFGSGQPEAHVVRWLLLGGGEANGGVGLVAPERRGVRVVTADAQQIRSSWFPIDWRCSEGVIACRGDLAYADPPTFLDGDVLREAWRRSRVDETVCAARIEVPAREVREALRAGDPAAFVTFQVWPDDSEVRVGGVVVGSDVETWLLWAALRAG